MTPRSRDDLHALLGRALATPDRDVDPMSVTNRQARHEAAGHGAGLRCQKCPVTIEAQARLDRYATDMRVLAGSRGPAYYRRRFIARLLLWTAVTGLLGWYSHDLAQWIGLVP